MGTPFYVEAADCEMTEQYTKGSINITKDDSITCNTCKAVSVFANINTDITYVSGIPIVLCHECNEPIMVTEEVLLEKVVTDRPIGKGTMVYTKGKHIPVQNSVPCKYERLQSAGK